MYSKGPTAQSAWATKNPINKMRHFIIYSKAYNPYSSAIRGVAREGWGGGDMGECPPPRQEKRLKFVMIKKLKVRNVPPAPPSGIKEWISRQINCYSGIVCGGAVLSVQRSNRSKKRSWIFFGYVPERLLPKRQ